MIDTKLFDWIGGKKWLSSKLNNEVKTILDKKNIQYYIESFCGSLGYVIGCLNTFKQHDIHDIILNDINKGLINVFLTVKEQPDELFKKLCLLEKTHNNLIPDEAFNLHKTKDKERLKILMSDSNNYYLSVRDTFNKVKDNINDIDSAAYFLFIMYHAFNGLYRENQKGMNNSPYSWTNKKINLDNRYYTIMEYNKLFNEMNISFYNLPYNEFIEMNISFYNLPYNEFIDKFKYLSSKSIFYFATIYE